MDELEVGGAPLDSSAVADSATGADVSSAFEGTAESAPLSGERLRERLRLRERSDMVPCSFARFKSCLVGFVKTIIPLSRGPRSHSARREEHKSVGRLVCLDKSGVSRPSMSVSCLSPHPSNYSLFPLHNSSHVLFLTVTATASLQSFYYMPT